MNRDSEVAPHILLWLLRVSSPGTQSSCDDASLDGQHNDVGSAAVDQETAAIAARFPSSLADDVQGRPVSSTQTSGDISGLEPGQTTIPSSPSPPFPAFTLGELIVVQDYVYTLLKDRLRVEIAKNPPLFPWETELQDYPLEPAELSSYGIGAIWDTQLAQFQGAIALPPALMQHLFVQAQAVLQTGVKSGRALVQMVQDWFPPDGQSHQALETAASLVLMSPNRSGTQPATAFEGMPIPASYDAASPQQQMVVSMLTAQQLLDWLTLRLSPTQPQAEREWHTSVGIVTVSCTYAASTLHVDVNLPTSGQIQLVPATGVDWLPQSDRRADAGQLRLTQSIAANAGASLLRITLDIPNRPEICWSIALTD